ncbi:DUF4346 domain-containing protein [Hyperthermus butylicus]|uniref:Conserved archaeal protein n=1 Tax=Hyperthermus butylicus (strain DSM 5456 / JCM 9403 / PLM1-5) TaxID=415426 RepID=A2BKZ6_HYPBU|nr:hypothetical protein [Hyperthermus butylicus]ABM80657.1 conserved archaeal protein [Hyperthermus butylicus DSM 5456]
MKVAIVTGRRATSFLRDIARELSKRIGWTVDVVAVPVEVAALIPREALEQTIERLDCSYDMVIVPGTLPYSLDEIRAPDCLTIVKGPIDPTDLLILAELGEEGLRELRENRVLSPELVAGRWLEELKRHHNETLSIEVCGVRVPVRPPPIVVAAELYYRPGLSIADRVEQLLSMGADIVVMGFGADIDPGEAMEVVRTAARIAGQVAIDSPDKKLVARAVKEGYACLAFTASEASKLLDLLPRGSSVVVAPYRADYSVPSNPHERVALLQRLVREARSRGLTPIADPLVEPPGHGFAKSVTAYILASEVIDTPLLAGIANVYELVDADSHGQIAVLTQLYGEAGASIMLVTEESRKSRFAVAEAAIAATLTGLSLLKKRPPKELGLGLFYAKEKRPRKGVPLASKPERVYDASKLAAWVSFRQDRLGNHLIAVEGGVIRDLYIGSRGIVEVRGRRAEDIYKAITYLGLASEPSHYAYLGYELCKAELALELELSYVQEEPLITPPWKNALIYSVREKRPRRLG